MNSPVNQECRHFEDTLSEWVFEKTVEEKRLAPLKGHLKTCPSCRALKVEFESLVPLLQKETLSAAPSELKETVMNKITGKDISSRRSPVAAFVKFAAAASVLLVVALSAYQYKNHGQVSLGLFQKQFNGALAIAYETPTKKSQLESGDANLAKDNSFRGRSPANEDMLKPLAMPENKNKKESLEEIGYSNKNFEPGNIKLESEQVLAEKSPIEEAIKLNFASQQSLDQSDDKVLVSKEDLTLRDGLLSPSNKTSLNLNQEINRKIESKKEKETLNWPYFKVKMIDQEKFVAWCTTNGISFEKIVTPPLQGNVINWASDLLLNDLKKISTEAEQLVYKKNKSVQDTDLQMKRSFKEEVSADTEETSYFKLSLLKKENSKTLSPK